MATLGRHEDEVPQMAPGGGADFIVGVDSGTIQITRNPDHLERGMEVWRRIREGSLETAWMGWDGKRGAIETPQGDGAHRIVYDTSEEYAWRNWRMMGVPYAFLVSLPQGKLAKPFTLYLGDGRIAGEIVFPEHNLIAVGWFDPTTLRFTSDID